MARSFIWLRYSLLCCIVLLGVTGIAVSIGSGYFIYRLYEYPSLTPNNVCGPPALLLAMGILACLLGWCGYYFLDHNNVMQALIFTVFLGSITFVEISTGIWAFVRHEKVDEVTSLEAKKAFTLSTTDFKKNWDRMQSRLKCCGVYGPSDYANLPGVPWSCHKITSTEDSHNSESFYKIGCIYASLNHTRAILLNVIFTSFGSVLLQICFLVVAIGYVRAMKKKREKRRQEVVHFLKSKALQST